jgi:hypothetical protein
MQALSAQLDGLIKRLENSQNFKADLDKLTHIFPFSPYEYIISTLLSHQKLSFEEYLDIRDAYINRNLYLSVFEISAPRGFGDTWAFGHLMAVEPALKRPSKKEDSTYKGEYDLSCEWQNPKDKTQHFIKIEVKASRAVDREKADEPLYIKALSADSDRPFLMNFQQLKPNCADVFLWIAVYRNSIKYWVIDAKTVQNHKYFTPQHRNHETADRTTDYNKSTIFEGQIMMTNQNINEFAKFLVENDLKQRIIAAYKKQKNIR